MTSLEARAAEALKRTFVWSAEKNFQGYDKHDALLSPLINVCTLGIRPLEFAAVQAVMRAPVNLRPMLGVRTARNPKGIGLFLRALLAAESLDPGYRETAKGLAEWLLAHSSRVETGMAWGYQFPWPSIHFKAEAGAPNAIVTTFVGEGLLDAYIAFKEPRFLGAASKASEWLLALPHLIDEPTRLCLGYTPSAKERIININSVVAGFLSRLAAHSSPESRQNLLESARRLLRYVASVQTPEGAWYYADPAAASHIEHDNYHTGGVLDGFLDYVEADAGSEFSRVFQNGLDFYATRLFESDGFPRWERRSKYPGDVHGAAQGVITFSRAGRIDAQWNPLADRILKWTLERLYHPDGRFYLQVRRFGIRRTTLMRWCNAWMARALAVWLATRRGDPTGPTV